MSSFAVSPKQKQAGGKQASKQAEMMMMTIWRRSIEWLEFRSRGIEHTTTHSKPSIDHGSIKCKSWRSQSRGADKGDRERERERGPHAGSELIASTRHKNLSEKGPGLQREKRREEQKNYKHALRKSMRRCASTAQHRTPTTTTPCMHARNYLIAQKLLVF